MTDERMDALIRRLDVTSDPDPDFVRSTYLALRPGARAAHVSDASWTGRLRRDLRLVLAGARWPSTARPVGTVGLVGLVVLLVLATMVALAVVGALNQDQLVQNGPSPGPSAAVVPPRAAAWTATGKMITPRYGYMATPLLDGRVLVVGGETIRPRDSAELYDPVSEMWTATGSMITPRYEYVATRLPDGRVLVAGGYNNDTGELASVELYDPISGTWTATGAMATGRRGHTLTLLPNGKVLVGGGIGLNGLVTSAELYDPINGTWTATGAMSTGRIYHTATLLPDGKVLVAAGHQDAGTTSQGSPTAELYDPISGTWSVTGAMVTPHSEHTATLLPDGKVLVAGGASDAGRVSAELYDPISGTWRATGAMVTPRGTHTATLLPDGRVLVVGGGAIAQTSGGEFELLASAELYDPASGNWSATASMVAVRQDHTATLLPDGTVLVAGGLGVGIRGSVVLASADLYDPGSGN